MVEDPQHGDGLLIDRIEQDKGCSAWPTSHASTQLWPGSTHQRLKLKRLSVLFDLFQNSVSRGKVFFSDVNPGFQQISTGAFGKYQLHRHVARRLASTWRPSDLMAAMSSTAVRPEA